MSGRWPASGLLVWLLACGPALPPPPAVPAWRRELERLQARHELDGDLDRAGRDRLALLLELEAGAPDLADGVDALEGGAAALRRRAFRALERASPQAPELAARALAAAPADPASLGLACALQAARRAVAPPAGAPASLVAALASGPAPRRIPGGRAALAALLARADHDPRALRPAWWLARAVAPAQAAGIAARWATAWPGQPAAWAAVAAEAAGYGPRRLALERAAAGGHMPAAVALAALLDASGRATAADTLRDRLRRGLGLPPGAGPEAWPAPAPTPPLPAGPGGEGPKPAAHAPAGDLPPEVRRAAEALPIPGPAAGRTRHVLWVAGWRVEQWAHLAEGGPAQAGILARPAPGVLRWAWPDPQPPALAFAGPVPFDQVTLVVARPEAPGPLDGPTPKPISWAGEPAWRATRAGVTPAPAGVPEAWLEGLALRPDARAAAPPAGRWRITGDIDLSAGRLRLAVAAEGAAAGALQGLAGAPGSLAWGLARILPVAGLDRLDCAPGRCQIEARLWPDAPGPWLPLTLPQALGLAPAWPLAPPADQAILLSELALEARWTVRGSPLDWRGARAWATFERAGPWGKLSQAVTEGPDGASVVVHRLIELTQPALRAGDEHGRAALREAALLLGATPPPAGGD